MICKCGNSGSDSSTEKLITITSVDGETIYVPKREEKDAVRNYSVFGKRKLI